jgi:hypothetical protein
MRIAAASGSALLIFLAGWGAGVFDQWRLWFGEKPDTPIAARPASGTPQPPSAPQASEPVGLADDGAVGTLRLISTQPGRNAREGTAQLATGGANPLTYIAGALLANGASLLEVYADHVILKRNDLTTELYVDGIARNPRAGKAQPAREELITVAKSEIQPVKIFGPETYADVLRVAPRFTDGKISGFEVYAGTNSGMLNRLNLQSGDVVLEIDGRVLTSVEQLHSSLKQVRNGASVMATVQRGSEQLVVSMDGAMLELQQTPPPASMPAS